ncbi:phosphotransferase [Streptomyces sp. NPDC051018]|uniref:phosphotransferase n=1 Tax=Streptomyces sp. NPDC051018 TaxID=3365639 RepID=UPI00379BBF7A
MASGHGMRPADAGPQGGASAVAGAGDIESVTGFAARVLGEPPSALVEIGNGNLNQVFRARSATESVIIKRALPYVRSVGPSWPLTTNRVRIEADAYAVHEAVSPGSLPRLIARNDAEAMIALEDVGTAGDWRGQLIAGASVPGVGRAVGAYCGDIIVGTEARRSGQDPDGPARGSDGIGATGAAGGVNEGDRAARYREAFDDATMQRFTERMVFRAPFEHDSSNSWPPHLRDVAARIRADRAARDSAAKARRLFMTSAECLLHGDLHTGSVLADDAGGVRVIDLEFAFYGPPAFDVATFLAHLCLARIRRTVLDDGHGVAYLDRTAAEFWAELIHRLRARASEPHRYTGRLVSHAALFMGIELLRRIGGRFKVEDLMTLPERPREAAERLALGTWHDLVSSHATLRTFPELWDRAVNSQKGYL